MAYELSEINRKAKQDPFAFVRECDAVYQSRIEQAADLIIENRKKSIIEAYERLSDEEKENGREKYENDINEINLESTELNTKYAHILDADGNLNLNGEYVLYIEDYADNGTVIKSDKLTLTNICKNFNIPLN